MKIIYVGYKIFSIYSKCRDEIFSSSLLYGGEELKKRGADVVYLSQSADGFKDALDKISFLGKMKGDVLFFPYLDGRFYVLLAIAKKIGFLRRKLLIGILHFTPKITKSNRLYIKRIYKQFGKVYFHSPLTMKECIELGIVKESQAELLHWGADLPYIDKYTKKAEYAGDFISTGIENRDYATLIDAFGTDKNGNKLNIYVFNNGQELDNKNYNNVTINYIQPEHSSSYYTACKAKEALCVVVPINSKGLTYCTGHTSIVEAMALGKPIIVTDNKYHPIDVEKEGIGLKVAPNDTEAWQKAVDYIASHKEEAEEMGRKGRKLAESVYNMEKCADQIYSYIMSTKKIFC